MIFNKKTCSIYETEDRKRVIGIFEQGEVGYLKKNLNGCYYIQSGELTGYVEKDTILVGESATKAIEKHSKKQIQIEGDNAYVYEDKEAKGRVIAILTKGQILSLNETTQQTYEVTIDSDKIGYIKKENTEVKPIYQYATSIRTDESNQFYGEYESDEAYDEYQNEDEESIRSVQTELQVPFHKRTEQGKQVVDYACQFVGNPYVWGGTSLTKGADCSGFIQSVYKKFGYSLARTSKDLREEGTLVSTGWKESQALPGDIVCYEGHVALYMGNGKIVHAANKKQGIIISENVEYRSVVCVRRVFEEIKQSNSIVCDKESKDILYRIVEAEAGEEDFIGKMLVTQVIVNRLQSKQFPNTIREVVFAKKQFSPVRNGRIHTVIVSNETKKAVETVLQGTDNAKGALYFMARNDSSPKAVSWFDSKLTYLFTHGGHEFFK